MHAPEEASRRRARAQVEAGVQTEVELLGPMEAGSSVLLEGVVWNETESGARAPLLPSAPCRARLLRVWVSEYLSSFSTVSRTVLCAQVCLWWTWRGASAPTWAHWSTRRVTRGRRRGILSSRLVAYRILLVLYASRSSAFLTCLAFRCSSVRCASRARTLLCRAALTLSPVSVLRALLEHRSRYESCVKCCKYSKYFKYSYVLVFEMCFHYLVSPRLACIHMLQLALSSQWLSESSGSERRLKALVVLLE